MKVEKLRLYMFRVAGLIMGGLASFCFVYMMSSSVKATTIVESIGELEVRFATSDLTSINEDMMFLLNENGKSVWRFIGPETRDDLAGDCNDLNWDLVDQKRVKEVEAEVVKEGESVTEVFHIFDLPEGATNAMGYCFSVPITNAAGENGWLFQYRKLAAQTPTAESIPGTIKITESASLEGTDIPSSIILTPSSEGLELIAWGYAVIEDKEECRIPTALNIQFSSLNVDDRGQAELKLEEKMAGQIICIQAQNEANGDFLFSSYVVPTLEAGKDSGSAMSIVIVVVVVAAAIGAGLLFFKRVKDNQDN